MRRLAAVSLVALALGAMPSAQRDRVVTLVRLPEDGIQPQIAVDPRGILHAVYFRGEPAAGDLFYARLSDDGTWSSPVRVNSRPGSAIATGTVRGARIAVGRGGRVHVAWNGSGRATPTAPGGATPMLYARSDSAGTAFEAERNLIHTAVGLDGGGAIATDARGRVFVAWHAGGSSSKGEGDRRVWVAASADDGATFTPERPASDAITGACGCCGMDGLIDRRGALYLLYRSAREVVHRDTYLLVSRDGAKSFTSARLQEWNVGACPMSTFALTEGPDGVIAAWETGGQVQYTRVGADASIAVVEAPGAVRTRRHPALATNAAGDVLLAWTEGTGWQRGGSLAWQVFDKAGRPTAESGRAAGVPVWSLPAAHARRAGGFRIVY